MSAASLLAWRALRQNASSGTTASKTTSNHSRIPSSSKTFAHVHQRVRIFSRQCKQNFANFQSADCADIFVCFTCPADHRLRTPSCQQINRLAPFAQAHQCNLSSPLRIPARFSLIAITPFQFPGSVLFQYKKRKPTVAAISPHDSRLRQ